MSLQVLIALLAGCLCAAAGQLLLKIGATGRSGLWEFVNAPLAAGLVLYVASAVLWIFALSREQLVTVFPFTLLTFVFVVLAGVLVLHERVSILALSGMACIVLGVALVAMGSGVRT